MRTQSPPNIQLNTIARRRARISPELKRKLEDEYQKNSNPKKRDKIRIAKDLCMSSNSVHFWFQNRRAEESRNKSQAKLNHPILSSGHEYGHDQSTTNEHCTLQQQQQEQNQHLHQQQQQRQQQQQQIITKKPQCQLPSITAMLSNSDPNILVTSLETHPLVQYESFFDINHSNSSISINMSHAGKFECCDENNVACCGKCNGNQCRTSRTRDRPCTGGASGDVVCEEKDGCDQICDNADYGGCQFGWKC
ncbi:hypothetical protein BJ944DRAFT_244342 [Cunninghamella echinulata]|nr:hypothetical protein BJ944DRAFT_244342 [Cunninghamella echinulata]